jgi:putative transposase
MKRWQSKTPRLLTFSCHWRLALLGTPETRDVFSDAMACARERLGFKLLAWVVMPEHMHLLAIPMQEPVPVILRSIKQTISQRTLHRWKQSGARVLGRLNVGDGRTRFWQAGGGFDRNVRDTGELTRTIEYIHENPVTRELVASATDWAWSSARSHANWEGSIPHDEIRWSCH